MCTAHYYCCQDNITGTQHRCALHTIIVIRTISQEPSTDVHCTLLLLSEQYHRNPAQMCTAHYYCCQDNITGTQHRCALHTIIVIRTISQEPSTDVHCTLLLLSGQYHRNPAQMCTAHYYCYQDNITGTQHRCALHTIIVI